jgi:hypothetical protein
MHGGDFMGSLYYAAALVFLGTTVVRAEEPLACQQSYVPLKARTPTEIWPEQLPARDYLDLIIDCLGLPEHETSLPPRSLWVESQKTVFAAAVARTKADVFIAPFQTQGYGLDRIERAIMTADLAYELGRSRSVADPFLVARALGEGARRFEQGAIMRLAHAVGARRVVVPYVGHDRNHRMTISIQVFELTLDGALPQSELEASRDWRAIPFTDDDPPYSVFHRMLPVVLKDLALTSPSPDRSPSLSPVGFPSRVAVSFPELATADPLALPTSVGLALLGTLAATAGEMSRERLFERAYVASLHFDEAGAATDFLRAYTLMNLRRRPAALALIQDSSRPVDVVLGAILNGDLPGATTGLAAVPSGLERLLLSIQINDMRLYYERQGEPPLAESVAVFGEDAVEWHALVEGRSSNLDPWSVEPAVVPKYLMDEVFPVQGLDARTLLEGGIIVRAPADDISVDSATARHARRFVETANTVPCCDAGSAKLNTWDLMFLLEGRGEARISRELYRLVRMQGLPEEAAVAFARYDDLFSGHPLLAGMRAEFSTRMSYKATLDTRETWLERAREDSLVATVWSAGQNSVSLRGVLGLGIPSPLASPFIDAYGFDYPRQSFWPEWCFGYEERADIREALQREADAHNQTDLEHMARSVPRAPERQRELATVLQSRFIGHPHRATLLAGLNSQDGTTGDTLEPQRAALAEDPDNWDAYMSLAELLITRDGNYEEAAEILMSYPRFQGEPEHDRVAISNMAYRAGSLFFSRLYFDLARPFFAISAGLNTGAETSMTSAFRLSVLDGDYFTAVEELARRAERYPSSYAYGEYFTFLHAVGSDDDAWSGFSQFAGAFDGADIWYSALVGQRREGMTEEAARAWLRQPEIRDARFRSQRFALGYAILFNTTDRLPPADLGELVAELEGVPEARIDSDGYSTARPHPLDPSGFELLGPANFRLGRAERLPEGTPIKSDLAYFAAAFASLSHNDFAKAVEEFTAMADRYPVDKYTHSFVLPYFARAAAETGDAIGLERYLKLQEAESGFDYLLARALFAGARDEADEALALVERALRHRPWTGERPIFSTYQVAEAYEWLHVKTKDPRFLELLLDWVVKRQIMQPTDAWAYALEYAYSGSEERRTRALAMTLYLDPLSERIKSATAAELDKARAWGNENNPFSHRRDEPDENLIASVNPAR